LLAISALLAASGVLLAAIASVSVQASAASNHSLAALKLDGACFAAQLLSSSGDGTATGAGVKDCPQAASGVVEADGELG